MVFFLKKGAEDNNSTAYAAALNQKIGCRSKVYNLANSLMLSFSRIQSTSTHRFSDAVFNDFPINQSGSS